VSPAELVGSLRRRGVVLVPSSDRQLRYRPQAAVSPAESALLADQREAIVDCLESDPVGWRAAVMETQVRSAQTLPLLLARPGLQFSLGRCCSCGDALPAGHRYRCSLCTEAVVLALLRASWSAGTA
jgi:hypothetical protein